LASPSTKPTISQISVLNAMMDYPATITLVVRGVVSVSALTGSGTKRSFSVKAVRPGAAALVAKGASPLVVFTGVFKNHAGFEFRDLIADVFRSSDPAKMHILTRMLFNEESKANQKPEHWCKPGQRDGCLPCGTVAKVGAKAVFHNGVEYDYQPYSKPVPGMGTAEARARVKREDVKYDEARLKRGCHAIQKRLAKGMPSIVGLVYNLSAAVQANGTLNETGDGGHSVLIVGCNADATQFLYIDVYPGGSKLKYLGGHGGTGLFPWECNYLGVFEWTDDRARRCPVLRARPGTDGPSGIFSGEQFLEVVSGPLTG
jgi:hypothetical protein